MNTTDLNTYCANHPRRETTLRCNQCEKLICASCAVRTPTGYRCKECIKGQLKTYYDNYANATWFDYVAAFFTASFLSWIASLIVYMISGFFFGLIVIFIVPVAGRLIAKSVQTAVRKHRGRELFITAVVGMILGGLPMLAIVIFDIIHYFGVNSGFGYIWLFLPLAWQIFYLVVGSKTLYARLFGIQIS